MKTSHVVYGSGPWFERVESFAREEECNVSELFSRGLDSLAKAKRFQASPNRYARLNSSYNRNRILRSEVNS
jgi:hypothetical protein